MTDDELALKAVMDALNAAYRRFSASGTQAERDDWADVMRLLIRAAERVVVR